MDNLRALLVAFLCLGTANLSAQDAESREPLPKVYSELEVTAEKKTEPAQAVPVSMSIHTQRELERGAITSIKEASTLVPNLFISEFSARRTSYPYIRGIGSGLGDPAVTTYIDGVPQLTPNTTNVDLLGLERIEFLRGPQGTLYGRNTLGGLIHLITRQPEETWRTEWATNAGNEDYQRHQLSTSGSLGNGLSLGLSAAYDERDGFANNDLDSSDVDGRRSTSIRAQLSWQATDLWRVRFQVQHQKDRDGGFTLYDLASLRARPHRLSHDFAGFTERDIVAPSLTIDRLGAKASFSATIAFADWDAADASDLDFGPLDLLRRNVSEDQQQQYLEMRWNANEDGKLNLGTTTVDWVAGISYYQGDFEHQARNEFRPSLVQLPVSLSEIANYQLDDSGLGIFGQASLAFNETFSLDVGLRYLDESREADLDLASQAIPPPANALNTKIDADFDAWLPKIGLNVQATQDVLLYLSTAEGYRSGGYNRNTDPLGTHRFDEESSRTYELGLKSVWADGRFLINGAAFYTDWEDRQLEVPNPILPGRFFLANVGDARSTGWELEWQYLLSQDTYFYGGYGLAEAEFRDYLDPNSGTNVDGNRLPNIPRDTWHAGAYIQRPFAGGFAFGRAVVSGIGNIYFDNLNQVEEESHRFTDVNLGWQGHGFKVQAWIKNAFDEEHIQLALPSPFSASGYAGRSGNPRHFGLTIGYTF